MNSIEKAAIIQAQINNLSIHISILEKDILDGPELDIDGKPLRMDVLSDIRSMKNALEAELYILTD